MEKEKKTKSKSSKHKQEKKKTHEGSQHKADTTSDRHEQKEERTAAAGGSHSGSISSVDVNRGYVLSTFLINLALGQKLGLLKKKSLLLNQEDLEELSADLSYIIDVKLGV